MPAIAPASTRRDPLRASLLAVIAVGLVLFGGGLSVALGIGTSARDVVPAADSVAAGFSRDMARHHLQAVEMANLALERSDDPAVRGLAFDIAETQNNQVGRMHGWLSLWGVTPTGGETMVWMEDASGAHVGHGAGVDGSGAEMPGMATEEELTELRGLSGTAFDVQFLRLMIRHHQGGLGMAEHAAEHGDVAAVRRLAETIAGTQTAETQTMTDLLRARGGTPLPAP